jgi:serine/threonine protein kinase
MADYDGWQTIEPPLGEGGQGVVYKARSPERAAQIKDTTATIDRELHQLNGRMLLGFEELAKLIVKVGGPDDVKDLGALKIFQIPPWGPERERATGRLKTEVNALTTITHPAVLKLLHHNEEENFIVTEYHPLRGLNRHLDKYRGRALEALLAFKPLVEGIALIHEQGAIHRDIKTENILVATDGRLVLADFGIVFFAEGTSRRLTEIYGERVGSHYWMAPWVYAPARVPIEDIKPALDLFPMGKVLWSMVAGRNGFPFWEYGRPENSLVEMFPEDPSMQYVNEVLSKCIVREERDCVKTAEGLMVLVDEAINNITHLDRRTRDAAQWLCLVCKKGHYGKEKLGWRPRDFVTEKNDTAHIGDLTAYFCDYCGHVQFFKPKWIVSGT